MRLAEFNEAFQSNLTHGDKSAAFDGLCRGGALVFQDAEALVQRHGRLLQRDETEVSMLKVKSGFWLWCGPHRLPHAVDVKLQRDPFRDFLLNRFRLHGSCRGSRRMQGPGGGGPAGRRRSIF